MERNSNVIHYDWEKSGNQIENNDCLRYRFLIIRQDQRDVNTAYSRLAEQLKPIIEERNLMHGNCEGYCFSCLELESLQSPDKISIGKLKRDRRLWDRQAPSGLDAHIQKILEALPRHK